MPLSQEEIEACRDAFMVFDKDRSGAIDVWELRLVLETMGQKPTEDELFQMISEVDSDKSGAIGEKTGCTPGQPFRASPSSSCWSAFVY